jgi:hypothetical protein
MLGSRVLRFAVLGVAGEVLELAPTFSALVPRCGHIPSPVMSVSPQLGHSPWRCRQPLAPFPSEAQSSRDPIFAGSSRRRQPP